MNVIPDLFAVRKDTWPAYVLGLLAVGLLTQVLNDVTELAGPATKITLRGAASAALFAVAILWIRRRYDRPLERRRLPEVKGMVVGLGPRPDPTLMAIDHHAATLRYCWLVHSCNPLVEEQLQQLQVRYGPGRIQFIAVNAGEEASTDPDAIYRAVEHQVFARLHGCPVEEEGGSRPLRPEEVVINLTPGHSVMTAGMVLAGIPSDRRLEYNPPVFDQEGKTVPYPKQEFRMGDPPRVPDYGRPVEVDLDEYLPAIARLWR